MGVGRALLQHDYVLISKETGTHTDRSQVTRAKQLQQHTYKPRPSRPPGHLSWEGPGQVLQRERGPAGHQSWEGPGEVSRGGVAL